MTKLLDVHRVALNGLNLGADPTQIGDGALTVADGIRFLEAGAAITRGGRKRFEMTFNEEGISGVDPSEYYSLPHLQAFLGTSAGVRGYAPYYDQMIYWEEGSADADVMKMLPEVLHHVYKTQGRLVMDGGIPNLLGDLWFGDANNRARFVPHGKNIYIADSSSAPKVFRRSSAQTHKQRVRYEARPMGINWPRLTADVPVLAQNFNGALSGQGFHVGIYRIRVTLENTYGIESNPSVSVSTEIDDLGSRENEIQITFPAIPDDLYLGPRAVTNWRVYASYQAVHTQSGSTGPTEDFMAEPTAFYFIESVAISAQSGQTLTIVGKATDEKIGASSLLQFDHGAPPRLKDLIIVNDVAVGIAVPDEVQRETFIASGEGRVSGRRNVLRGTRIVPEGDEIHDNTEITDIRVDGSYIFWSNPGEPEYMENYVRVGLGGREKMIGLAALGRTFFVFTDAAIYTFDPFEVEIRSVYSKVGCASTYSIVTTEQGIFFMGTDGVMRRFNGANVDIVVNEIAPIFNRSDWRGAYTLFDRAQAEETNAAYGLSTLYMMYPTDGSDPEGGFKPGFQSASNFHMAVGDMRMESPRWAIDRVAYDLVHFIPRTGQMIAIDSSGFFWEIESGLLDESTVGSSDTSPSFEVAFRKIAGNGLQNASYYRLGVDLDTQGETVTIDCRMDDRDDVSQQYTTTTTRREQKTFYFPGKFKGRFIEIRFSGAVAKRVSIYGVTLEVAPFGQL